MNTISLVHVLDLRYTAKSVLAHRLCLPRAQWPELGQLLALANETLPRHVCRGNTALRATLMSKSNVLLMDPWEFNTSGGVARMPVQFFGSNMVVSARGISYTPCNKQR